MPEKENQIKTIRFAGKDIDRNEFVRRAQAKTNQWMDYQMLQGDERTDFINSFNEVLQGIVDGRYSVSEFGKIQGIPSYENTYKERNGQRTDGKGTILSGRRIGFNPYTNVETYLNGVANSLKNIEQPAANKGKKWSNKTIISRISDAVFGEGNNQDPDENSAQLLAWANQYDPLNNGVRGTAGRKQFIREELNKYRDALMSGYYDISDEDKAAELDRINALSGDLNDFELGRIAPWMTHFMFTDETYMPPEQKVEQTRLDSYRNFINNGGTNPIDELTDPAGHKWLNEHRLQKVYSDFEQYSSPNKLSDSFTKPEPIIYNKKKINEIAEEPDVLNAILSKSLSEIGLGNFSDYDSYIIYYFNKNGTKLGNKSYIPDWEKGLLGILDNSNGQYSFSMMNLSDAIKDADKSLKEYLFKSYMKYNNTNIPISKNGGVLKALRGMSVPDVPEVPETPQQTPTQTTPPTNTPTNTLESGSTDDSREIGEIGTDPEDLTIPTNGETGRTPQKKFGVNPSDAYITWLENLKLSRAKQINQNVYNIMSRVRNFHATPVMEHYKQYTSKPLEDQIARNNADFNNMGNMAAAGTSDQGAAHAYQINYKRQSASANNPLVTKQADDTRASIDKENETAQRNNLYRHQVGEKNRQSDIALYNTIQHMLAELYSKNGNIDVNNIQTRQYGTAVNAEQNYNRDRTSTIWNDPAVAAARDEINRLKAKRYSGEEWTEQDKQDLLRANHEYQQALETATSNYDSGHITPTGTPYSGFGYMYGIRPSNPFPAYAKGGKMAEAEKEKTKRAYAKMFSEMMKMDMNHQFKTNRDAYNYYRKLFMQSK